MGITVQELRRRHLKRTRMQDMQTALLKAKSGADIDVVRIKSRASAPTKGTYRVEGSAFGCRHKWRRMTKHLRRFKRCVHCTMWTLRRGKKPLRASLEKLPALMKRRALPPVDAHDQHLIFGSEIGYRRSGPVLINKRVRIWQTAWVGSSGLVHYDIEVRLRRGWSYVGNVSEVSWYRALPHITRLYKKPLKLILALRKELYTAPARLSSVQLSMHRKKKP